MSNDGKNDYEYTSEDSIQNHVPVSIAATTDNELTGKNIIQVDELVSNNAIQSDEEIWGEDENVRDEIQTQPSSFDEKYLLETLSNGERIYSFISEHAGERLDVFLSNSISDVSRTRIHQLIQLGQVTVNKKSYKASMKMKMGMHVELRVPAPVILSAFPQNLPLHIVFEDDDIVVIDKPKGMVVHPAPGHVDGTLVNALMYHCGSGLSDINGVVRPGIVHRIDKDTSGLLVVAKNNESHQRLSEDLHEHQVKRVYQAIVEGVIKTDHGTVQAPIGRHSKDRKKMAVNTTHGRDAITHYRVLRRYQHHTYIECELETGRTHQIRVHMASLGHSITGDTVYGTECKLMNTEGQALHATTLMLNHPRLKKNMTFHSEMPDWMSQLIKILEDRER